VRASAHSDVIAAGLRHHVATNTLQPVREIQLMPALARQLDEWQPRLLGIVRIMAGLLFLQHGLAKFFNFPAAFPSGQPAMFTLFWFAAIIEVFGSLLLILGLFTRVAAFIMSGEMAIAYFYAHMPRGFFPLANGGDLAILFCFIFLYFVFAGGGAWSVDRLLSLDRR
jgi:putative oxidoreductase